MGKGEVTGSGDQARPGEKVVFGDGTCASTGMSRVRTHKVERPESSGEVDSVPAVNMLSSFSDSLSCLYCTMSTRLHGQRVCVPVRVVESRRSGGRKAVPLS
jgi:hypothetical protein